MAEKEAQLPVDVDKDSHAGTETAVPSTSPSVDHENMADEKAMPPDELTQQLSRIDSADYPSAWKLVMIVIALVLTVFLVALDMTIVSTAIPRITDEFRKFDQ